MLEFHNVHTYYGNSHILQGLSFKLNEGAVAVLLGRNGMGKTTTIRTAIGFNRPTIGKILFKGEDISNLPSYKIAKKGIALVPQGCRIFSSLTVMENLLIASYGIKGEKVWTFEKILKLFPIIKNRLKHKGNQLSGGERQMLAISRALISNPKLILMDEPSEGLALLIIKEVGRVIKELKSQGLSILLAEQNLSFALEVADQAFILHKGILVFQGRPDELENNKEVQDKYLAI